MSDLTDITLVQARLRRNLELNSLLERAIAALSAEWKPFAKLPQDEFLGWGAYDCLALMGIADMKIISPYVLISDDCKVYRGSHYEFKLSDAWIERTQPAPQLPFLTE